MKKKLFCFNILCRTIVFGKLCKTEVYCDSNDITKKLRERLTQEIFENTQSPLTKEYILDH